MTPHEIVNPPTLAPPVGFAHAVVAAPGRTVYLGGQTALDAEGRVTGETIADQFEVAARNVLEALRAAGGEAQHLVSLQIFVTDVDAYKGALGPIGATYREVFGGHYPAMALFGVSRLFDADAMVELVGVAVVP